MLKATNCSRTWGGLEVVKTFLVINLLIHPLASLNEVATERIRL